MAQVTHKPSAHPATITIQVDGVDRDIFMSFGLVDALSRLVAGSPELIAQIDLNPELRETALICLLAERKKSGKIITEPDLAELDISIDDIERLLAWATESLMAFLVRSVQRVTSLAERHSKILENLAERVSS